MDRYINILAGILISIPAFLFSFFLIIIKFICIDEILTWNNIFVSISINLIIFSVYFEVIYISKFNIFIQALHLIPYIILIKFNFLVAEEILQKAIHNNFELNSNDIFIVCDSIGFILLFILNVVMIPIEKSKKNPLNKIYDFICNLSKIR